MEGPEEFRACIINHPRGGSSDHVSGAALPKVTFDPFPRLTLLLIKLWATIYNMLFVDDNETSHFLFPPLEVVQRLTRPAVSPFLLFSFTVAQKTAPMFEHISNFQLLCDHDISCCYKKY